MFRKISLAFVATCVLAPGLQAALIINGDFSDSVTGVNQVTANDFLTTDIGQGWTYKSSWTVTGGPTGAAVQNSSFNNHWAFSQVNAVTTETGSMLTLALNWTPVSGATNTTLNYQVVGWKGTPTAGTAMFRFINGNSVGIQGGGVVPVDFLTGDIKGTGNSNATQGAITATAGSTNFFSTTIDLSGYGAGNDDVSDYSFIGVRFAILGNNASSQGSTIDNVSLTVVPEPSSISLLGLGVLGLLARRRR